MWWKGYIAVFILIFAISLNDAQYQFSYVRDAGYGQRAPMSEEQYQQTAERIVGNLEWLDNERISAVVMQGNLTSQCAQDFQAYIDGLSIRGFKKWALRMADSTGKLESGALDGNTIMEGRQAQCSRATDDITDPPIESLYCFAGYLNVLPLEHPFFISGLGVCVPKSCTDDDVLILYEQVYDPWYQGITDVLMKCSRGEDIKGDAGAIFTLCVLCVFALLILIASTYDRYQMHKLNKINDEIQCVKFVSKTEKDNAAFEGDRGNMNNNNDQQPETKVGVELSQIDVKHPQQVEEKVVYDAQPSGQQESRKHTPGLAEKLLLCFSIYKNLPAVVSAKEPANSISCLNGLRVIAMCCVVLGHVYGFTFYFLDNLHVFIEEGKEVAIQKLATMEVYVDTFFIMSAFLVSISFLKKLKKCDGKMKPIDVGIHYFNRYWRLTAIYMFVLMIYTNLTHYLIPDGPFHKEYIGDFDSCKTEWWKNMLYVNTLFISNGKFCFGVSWYLCVDMQMFVIAPLFLYLLYRWPKVGIVANIAGFCGGIIANIVLWEKFYTQPADAEDPVDSMFDIYVKTWTRCPVYFMGLLLGYLFYRTGGKIKMNKVLVAGGWLVALSMFFMCAWLPVLDGCYWLTELYPQCDWTIAGKVAWSSLYRPMWGIWVCWVITACASGYGGIVNTFLSWNFFVPVGKLTYVCFLIHFMVLYPYLLGAQIQPYFTNLNMFYIYFGIQVMTLIAALFLTVGASAPLMRLAAVFIPDRRGKQIR